MSIPVPFFARIPIRSPENCFEKSYVNLYMPHAVHKDLKYYPLNSCFCSHRYESKLPPKTRFYKLYRSLCYTRPNPFIQKSTYCVEQVLSLW